MDKTDKRNLLVSHATRLAVVVQGCSNHGCAFNDNKIGTNAICRCDHNAKELLKLIDMILNQK